MKLYWCKTDPPNVGDALNEWLWPKIIPQLDLLDPEGTLYGIGSILDNRLNTEGRKYILGSGARSKVHGIKDTGSLNILAVRGPLSASALKIPEAMGIIDPAALISRYYKPQLTGCDIGLVPYFSAPQQMWKEIAEDLGYRFISPHLSTEEFLSELSQCQFVISEAMHGAILSDSLRIPWHPIRGNSLRLEGPTNAFKWTDWCSSVQLPFDPVDLPPLWGHPNNIATKIRTSFKKEIISYRLRRIVKHGKRYISSETIRDSKIAQLNEVLFSFENNTTHPTSLAKKKTS